MKFTLPDGVFPSVKLSKSRQEALVEEADTVVRETIAANEAFIAQGAAFRNPQWRLVRSKEGLHVYRQRPSGAARMSHNDGGEGPISPSMQSTTWPTERSSGRHRAHAGSRKRLAEEPPLSPSSVVSEGSIQEQMRRPSVSLMVLHGTVDGSLDDSMFGAFAATDHAWMWRSSHINDRLDDARILTSIRGPTRKDPFRFLGIKWFAKEHPAFLTGILQRRDFLIMEATGLTTDSKGEKVGYFLMHSVSLRSVPELTEMGIVRGELSFCFTLRQSGPGRVELYCRGFSDPHGDMMERVSVAIAAEALICSAGVVDYAYIKKLTWLMKHKADQFRTHERQSSRETHAKHCESCNKSFTKFDLLAVAAGSATSGKGAACQIFRRVVCTKCSVVKKMTVDVSKTGAVKQCALRFCLACLLEAKEKPAWEMALDSLEVTTPLSPSTSGSSSSAGTPHARHTSIPTKLRRRRDGRSYSEYQRAGTRVYRQGEMATNFARTNAPDSPNGNLDQLNQLCRRGNAGLSGRFQTSPGVRTLPVQTPSSIENKYTNRAPSPPANHCTTHRRPSEKSKSLRDMRFRTMN